MRARFAAVVLITAAVATASPARPEWTQEIYFGFDAEEMKYPQRSRTTFFVGRPSPESGSRLCVMARVTPAAGRGRARFTAVVHRRDEGGALVEVSRARSRKLRLVLDLARACLPVGRLLEGDSIDIRYRFYKLPGGRLVVRPRVTSVATLEPLFDTASSIRLAVLSRPFGSEIVGDNRDRVDVEFDYVCAERVGCDVWVKATGPYGYRSAGWGWSGRFVFRGSGTESISVDCGRPGSRSYGLELAITRRNQDVVDEQLIFDGFHCVEP